MALTTGMSMSGRTSVGVRWMLSVPRTVSRIATTASV
jgi:hypothetical protein